MVIVIANDETQAREALASAAGADGRHVVLTAVDPAGLAELAAALDDLDVLLFAGAFRSAEGKALREQLRADFPGMQAVLVQDAPVGHVMAWLAEAEARQAVAPPGAGPVLLGDYELLEKRRTTSRTDTFRAVQRSVNREVVLERLKPEFAHDAAALRDFRGMVRARAAVTFPGIAAVYEAQEREGVIFYTRELVRGRNPEEIAAAGHHLPPVDGLRILSGAAEALTWLEARQIPREVLHTSQVFHSSDGTVRVANLAMPAGAPPPDQAAEIRALAAAVARITDLHAPQARHLTHVLGLMKATGPHALATWRAVQREAGAALRRIAEAGTTTLAEGTGRRRGLLIPALLGVGLVAGVAAVIASRPPRRPDPPAPRDVSAMVKVPAGEFTYRDGQRLTLPDFWIDRHEVPIASYAAFLEALASGDPKRFDHEDQPAAKEGHEPKEWAAMLEAARAGQPWRGAVLTLNSPIFNVDWWDAWAFARWKGRRLPTQQEWEKAARGTDGRAWPWGPEPDPTRANTGADHPGQGGGGPGDGFPMWCDVDAVPGDVSPWGVHGMAGNVAEWTADWAPHPELPDEQVPVFRGGDFRQTKGAVLSTPWLARDAVQVLPFLGFRTAASTPP